MSDNGLELQMSEFSKFGCLLLTKFAPDTHQPVYTYIDGVIIGKTAHRNPLINKGMFR